MQKKLETLRKALTSLKPTGKDGFEGLLALALGRITQNPMRLASSGYQFGIDGQGEDHGNPVCFEAKRYSKNLTRETVLTKIADLGRRDDEADILWVLGATTEVPNQLAQNLRTDGMEKGVSTLILDWNNNGTPALAVTLANAGDDIGEWIATRSKHNTSAKELSKTLEELRIQSDYVERWSALSKQFSASEISTNNATVENKKWLKETLQSEVIARQRLGQPTAPCSSKIPVLQREEIQLKIKNRLETEASVVIVGEEGRGKSWVAAQAALNASGLAIVIGAERFEGLLFDSVESLIVRELARQCGEGDKNPIRWQRRVDAWRKNRPAKPFIVVVDGINQRPNVPWDRMLTSLEGWLVERGGKLIVTSRPGYFARSVRRGFERGTLVTVGNWTSEERDEILSQKGIQQDWLDPVTKDSLLNPRLLGIALAVLPAEQDAAWKGLTVERLLFEHIMRTQIDQFEIETPENLCLRLSADAGRVLDQIDIANTELPTPVFEDETRAVAESRFFQSIPGPHGGYTLKDEGLNLALGFAVVDRLWTATRRGSDLNQTASALLDPVAAVDASTPVVTAAMYICAFDDERFDPEIFKCLVSAFCNLQNLDEGAYPQFLDTLRKHPDTALIAVKDGLLERRSQINAAWLSAAALDMFNAEQTKQVTTHAVQEWLKHVNIDAVDQQSSYGRVDQQDHERAKTRQQEIDLRIDSFSALERQLFEECHVVEGDVERLLALAIQMLAGQPLAPWAGSFVHLGFAFNLDHSLYKSRKLFQQLTHFNTIDPIEAASAFEKSVEPFRSHGISQTGRWTLVRMLYATGNEKLSEEAKKTARELRADRDDPEYSSQIENYCTSDPCDPASLHPKNVDKTIDDYKKIDVTELFSHMGHNQQDWFRDGALCAVSRFGPDVAIAKNRELAEAIVHREKMHLRQLALNGTSVIPLMTADKANALAKRLRSNSYLSTLPENDRRVVQMFMLNFCLHHLNGNQQLELLTCDTIKGDYSLDAIPSLKRPDEDNILSALDQADKNKDPDAAFGALTMIAHTYDKLSTQLEAKVVAFREWDDALVRAAVFEIALYTENMHLRSSHASGDWTAISSEDSRTYESWNGSLLLIEATKRQEIGLSDMLKRISSKSLYWAAEKLGKPIENAILKVLDIRLRSACAASIDLEVPAVDVTLSPHDLVSFSFASAEDREGFQPKGTDALKALSPETNEDFAKRQARLKRQHDDLELSLEKRDAKVLLEAIDVEVLINLLAAHPELADQWSQLLLGLRDREFYWFKDFSFALGRAIVGSSPVNAIQLFERATVAEGFIKRVYRDGLTLEQKAIWSCPHIGEVFRIWDERLNKCSDDAELALEVLAAERFGASSYISKRVEDLIASPRPIDQSYGLTIAGFSHQLSIMGPIIRRFSDSPSFVGDSARAAHKSHERALWSEQWVSDMWASETAEAFWIKLNLVGKIIDARSNYDSDLFQDQQPWKSFITIFTRLRSKRIIAWQKERAKTLLGMEKPEESFLPH